MARHRLRRRPGVCANCHQPFLASRRDARYCSATCRKAAHRSRSVAGSVPDEPEAVTGSDKPRSYDLDAAMAYLEWKRQYERPEL